jgi:anti-sigma regulatory factor (Ser/Thr protein kinase)
VSTTRVEVRGGLDASAAARREVLARCDWPSQRVRDDVALMIGEIVTNAVQHGGMGVDARIRIDVEQYDSLATVSVFDRGPAFVPAAHRPGSWGLLIVERLARRWGVRRRRGEKSVWFEVETP